MPIWLATVWLPDLWVRPFWALQSLLSFVYLWKMTYYLCREREKARVSVKKKKGENWEKSMCMRSEAASTYVQKLQRLHVHLQKAAELVCRQTLVDEIDRHCASHAPNINARATRSRSVQTSRMTVANRFSELGTFSMKSDPLISHVARALLDCKDLSQKQQSKSIADSKLSPKSTVRFTFTF